MILKPFLVLVLPAFLGCGGLSNSHHQEFKAVDPHDREGDYQVLVEPIKKRWKR